MPKLKPYLHVLHHLHSKWAQSSMTKLYTLNFSVVIAKDNDKEKTITLEDFILANFTCVKLQLPCVSKAWAKTASFIDTCLKNANLS